MAKRGRPTVYTDELADEICERLAAGEGLNTICTSDEKFPDERTARRWAIDPNHPFSPKYARAREAQAERWASEIVSIADESTNDALRDRLRVDARKWVASKLLPKKYGDRQEIDLNATVNVTRVQFGSEEGEQ